MDLSEEEGSGRKMVALSAGGCVEPQLGGGAGLPPRPGCLPGETQNNIDSLCLDWQPNSSMSEVYGQQQRTRREA